MNQFARQQRRKYAINSVIGSALRASICVLVVRAMVAVSPSAVEEVNITRNTVTAFLVFFVILLVNPALVYRSAVGLIERLDGAFTLQAIPLGVMGVRRRVILACSPTDFFRFLDRVLSKVEVSNGVDRGGDVHRGWRVRFHELYDITIAMDGASSTAEIEVVAVRQRLIRWFYYVDTSSVVLLSGVLWVGCSEGLLRLDPPATAALGESVKKDLRYVLEAFGVSS